MKRERGKDSTGSHVCPYSGCNKQFRSARLLARHTSVHKAAQPLSCHQYGCTRTFALASERDAHEREVHPSHEVVEKRGTHVLSGDESHAETANDHGNAAKDHLDSPRNTQLEEEADEIAGNATYLASQMKVAREGDYLRAHQWARWVQESVEDFPDIAYLEHKIKEKGLSLVALQHAERAFFDSVLAYEGLHEEILNYLLTAASMIDGKERDAEDAEARIECLTAAIYDAVERKNRLRMAADLAGRLQNMTGLEMGDETLAAKAEILLSRHKEWDMGRVKKHVGGLDLQDAAVMELVCREAVLGHDAGVKFQDVLFEACHRGVRDGGVVGVDAELAAEVCERDVSFFDTYFSFLLEQIGFVRDEKEIQSMTDKKVNADDMKVRIKSLAMRKGLIGHVTRCAVEEFARRTGTRDLVTW